MSRGHALLGVEAGQPRGRAGGHGSCTRIEQAFGNLRRRPDGARSDVLRASMAPEGNPREDLAEVLARQAATRDDSRPEAVERRHAAGGRTARENIADLVDPGSFVEYGGLAIAAQRGRRDLQELIERTPADGLVAGTARVNGELFGERSACAVLSYDYTVLAGTQGVL